MSRVRINWVVCAAILFGAAMLFTPQRAYGQLYGRNIAQPYFDFPPWARFSDCRPGPLAWGFDPYATYKSCDGAEDCLPDHSCVEGFVAHRPNAWYATADFVPLTLDPGQNVEFARFTPIGATVLSANTLDNEFDSGGEFTIGRTLGDCYRVEGTYLGNYSWADSVTIQDSTPNALGGTGVLSTLLSQFALPTVAGLDNNNLVTASSFTQLSGAEINIRYWLDMPPGPFDVSLLVGARYLQFDDRLFFRSEANVPAPAGAVNQVITQTRNDLIGLQLGIEGAFLITTHTWFDFDLKGALCQNTASQNTNYLNVDNLGVASVFNTGIEQDRTAFLGDISTVFNIQFTPSMVFRIGYQATFVEGLAVAAQNVQTNNVLLRGGGPAQLDDDGSLVYHGPVIGFTYAR